ncbi:BON domain-containing protein, partial [Hymenobacter caeli]
RWGELQNSDEEITTQIRELLDWDIRVHSALVEVRTDDRVVHLSGTVGSAAEKAQVVTTAYRAGAARVDARDLFVAYWALSPELRRTKYADRSDEDIAAAVRATFLYDPRVLSYQPIILVHNGTVTLSGAVGNLRAKQDAERDARAVVGVWDVQNLLKVRTARFIPDDDVTQTIKAALARDPYLGFFDFSVRVRNGKASLYGQVGSHFEQRQAGAVAA